ncbi:hypothetical protein QFC19_007739 [Naganishia cerealis]|uniref:Uncharacterized protein n=1 Tax=Naganishia cerealis TaxID=610337 RepID=A0ACC2V7A1_9TREE|nr:hypothetical protein QFC19_007739 [Naganishia cerealis]
MDAEPIEDGGEESVSAPPADDEEDRTIPEILVEQLKPLLNEMKRRKKEYPSDETSRECLSTWVDRFEHPKRLLKMPKKGHDAGDKYNKDLLVDGDLDFFKDRYYKNLDVEKIRRCSAHLDLISMYFPHQHPKEKKSQNDIGIRKNYLAHSSGITARLQDSSSSSKPSLLITSRHGSRLSGYTLEHSVPPTPTLSGEQCKTPNRLSLCIPPSMLKEFAVNPDFQAFEGTLRGALSYLEESSGTAGSTIAATNIPPGDLSSETSHAQPLGGHEELERESKSSLEEESELSIQPTSMV